jgi:hypothetical protein
MTRRQRRVHRVVWWALPALVLAALIAANLSQRRAQRALAEGPALQEAHP